MELRLNLAAAIRKRRAELGLSQTQLAERIGPEMQQTDISRLERGLVSLPRPEFVKQLATALETTVLELFNFAGWLSDEELARYSGTVASAVVPLAERPLVAIAGGEPAATTTLVDLLSAGDFRYLLTFDARTLFEAITAQQPDVVIVCPMRPSVSMADLADVLWTNRLSPTVIIVGRSAPLLPAQFYCLDAPVTAEALWSVLHAPGYEER
jgi:transcriptional regulator with XRE-family HTH domain